MNALDQFAHPFLRRMDNGDFDGNVNEAISQLTQAQLLRATKLLAGRTRRMRVCDSDRTHATGTDPDSRLEER